MKASPLKIWMFTASDLNLNHGPVIHFLEIAEQFNSLNVLDIAFAPDYGNFIKTIPFRIKFTKKMLSIVPRSISFQIEIFVYIIYNLIFSKRPTHFYIRQSSWMVVPQIIAKLLNIKFIVELNGIAANHNKIHKKNTIFSKIVEMIESTSMRNADYSVAVTKGIALYIEKNYRVHSSKIITVTNGVNISKYKKIENEYYIKSNLLNVDSNNILIYSGTIERWQGVDLIIKVAKNIYKKRKDFKVIIIGNGSLEEDIKCKIHEEQLTSVIIMLKELQEYELVKYLSIATVGLLPIYCDEKISHDLSPMKLYTYLSMSLPVIATTMPGTMILDEKKCGITVEGNNIEMFSNAIEYYFNNPSECILAGKRARALVEEDFSWEKIAKKIINHISIL